MKNLEKTIKSLGMATLGTIMLATNVYANDLSKKINLDNNCQVEYKGKEASPQVLQMLCDDGFGLYNPNGDSKIDKICLPNLTCVEREDVKKYQNSKDSLEQMYGDALERHFQTYDFEISPKGSIGRDIFFNPIKEGMSEVAENIGK